MKNIFLFLMVAVILAGCSVKVVPLPVESGTINPDQSLTVAKQGITITAASTDPLLYSYNLETPVAAFGVTIANDTDSELAFNIDSFLLTDNEGTQYTPLTPEKVKEMISRDSYYLIPYPYVGFYYLEDYEKASADAAFLSQQPYFYEVYPQDIFTKALTGTTIIPKARVHGLLYFKLDMPSRKNVNLLFYRTGTSRSASPDFVFPFAVK